MGKSIFVLLFVALLVLTGCQSPAPLPAVEAAPLPDAVSPTVSIAEKSATEAPPPAALPSLTPSVTTLPTATPMPSPTSVPRITLLFTGIIVPARCVQAGIDKRNDPGYPYGEVADMIREADLAVGTLNATISDYPPKTGCVPTFVLVGDSRNAAALADAGFDVMSVATNHIKNCGLPNCGDRAFLDTLENLRQAGVIPVGAGINLADALKPVVVTVKGVRFGIVSLGQIEAMAFAGEDTPGIAILDDDNLRSAIAAAREISDVVIALPHWGPEYSPNPNPYQLHFAELRWKPALTWWWETTLTWSKPCRKLRGYRFSMDWEILSLTKTGLRRRNRPSSYGSNSKAKDYIGYELIPTRVDGEGRVRLADESEASEILERVQTASSRLR
jgi:hypothetical protein